MARIPESCAPVNARLRFEAVVLEAEATLQRTIELRLTEMLIAIVCHVLCRPYHRRRSRVPRRLRRDGRCSRCGSRASHRFTRNGFRERCLLTQWGTLAIHLPRVRCECGGSLQLDFGGLLRPYQRICDAVDVQIQRWGALALSLREMRRELEHLRIDPLSLRALNQLLTDLKERGIEPRLETKGESRRLSADTELALFRIAQEAFNNVKRHARASEVVATVEFFADRVKLTIEDNGLGFKLAGRTSDLVSVGRFGLVSMEERAHLLGGDLKVLSGLGNGTGVVADVPAPQD